MVHSLTVTVSAVHQTVAELAVFTVALLYKTNFQGDRELELTVYQCGLLSYIQSSIALHICSVESEQQTLVAREHSGELALTVLGTLVLCL